MKVNKIGDYGKRLPFFISNQNAQKPLKRTTRDRYIDPKE